MRTIATAATKLACTLSGLMIVSVVTGCALFDAGEAGGASNRDDPQVSAFVSTFQDEASYAPGRWAAYDVYADPGLSGYVNDVANRIAANAALEGAPVRVVIVDAPAPNATADDDNQIAITLGLIALLSDEAELAWVLSHEIAHLELGHPTLLADMTRAPDIDGFERRSALRRAFEVEADARGVELMTAAGYDATAARRVTALFGGSTIGGPLATHPGAEDRLAYLPESGTGARNAAAYLDAIDGLRFAFPGRLTALLREDIYVAPSLGVVIAPPASLNMTDRGDALEFTNTDERLLIRLAPAPPSALPLETALRDGPYRSLAATAGAGPLFDVAPIPGFDGGDAISGRAETALGGVETEVRLALASDGRRLFSFSVYYAPDERAEADAALAALMASLRPLRSDDAVLLDGFVIRHIEVDAGEDFAALAQRVDGPRIREAFFYYFNGLAAGEALIAGQEVKVVAYR